MNPGGIASAGQDFAGFKNKSCKSRLFRLYEKFTSGGFTKRGMYGIIVFGIYFWRDLK